MKIIAILFLSVSIMGQLLAQNTETYPRPGAEWKYCVYGDYPSFSVWSHTFAYTADTVIDGHTYAMIQHTEVNDEPIAPDGSSWWFPEEDRRTYLRQAGDTVYRFVNGQDYVFMVHGIEAGEGFTTFRSLQGKWDAWSCTDELPLTVLAAEEQEYGGTTYREVHMKDLDSYFNQEDSFGNAYLFIESIGLKHAFPFLTPEHLYMGDSNQSGDLSECLGGAFHLPTTTLYQYRDNETDIVFLGCAISLSADNFNADEASFLLFPNPSSGRVTLKIADPGQYPVQIGIYDLRGSMLRQFNHVVTETSMDLSGFAPGMYLVSMETESGVHTQKLVLE